MARGPPRLHRHSRWASPNIVAEGVETERQRTFLREHAATKMQGYYFSRPIAPEEFVELLCTHTAVRP